MRTNVPSRSFQSALYYSTFFAQRDAQNTIASGLPHPDFLRRGDTGFLGRSLLRTDGDYYYGGGGRRGGVSSY
eukprot:6933537-Pyramimonas_sp.AAC.4